MWEPGSPEKEATLGISSQPIVKIYRIFGISQLIGKWQQQCGLVQSILQLISAGSE